MPRILSIDPRVPVMHGVLIPRHAVDEQVRAHTTIRQARAYARKISSEAQKKASALEQQALREGFQAGLLDSLNAIFNALADNNQLHRQIEDALKQSVQKSLETSLQQPGLELHLLDGWLNSAPSIKDEILLILPHHAQSQIDVLKHRVEQATGIVPTVSTGESDNVVIQSGDQVYEFSPERTMEGMSGLVHSCFQRLDVRQQCLTWSAKVVQSWLEEIELRYKNIDVDHAESDGLIVDDDYDDLDDLDSESALKYVRS